VTIPETQSQSHIRQTSIERTGGRADMSTSAGSHESGAAQDAANDDADCRGDEQHDDEQLLRRLGKFTIGDEMTDRSPPANHR